MLTCISRWSCHPFTLSTPVLSIANGVLQDLPDVLEQALRVYAMLGALLIALVETEWERLLVLFRFCQYWVGRASVQAWPPLLPFAMAPHWLLSPLACRCFMSQTEREYAAVYGRLAFNVLCIAAHAQVFIALLTFKMATTEGRSCDPTDPHRTCDFNKSLELYRFASALALLTCALSSCHVLAGP